MQSSNHIGKIAMQYADAVKHGNADSRKRRTRAKGLAAYASLPKHRAFVPMITIWGGVLLALVTLVLPDQAIARLSSLTGVFLPVLLARLILAAMLACLGALLGYVVSQSLRRRALSHESDSNLVTVFKSRVVEPIDPTVDLGAESLDAPIVQTKPSDEADLSRRGYDIEAPDDIEVLSDGSCAGARGEAPSSSGVATSTEEPMPEPQLQEAEKPRALDLGEFASLPGRDAVWVEDPEAETATIQTPEPPAVKLPGSALEKLRQTPTEELSLVEMIERFAAALHERQAKERASGSQSEIAREAALAEGLKALALFTDAGFDKGDPPHVTDSQIGKTENELKRALARLQESRGAA